MQNIACRLLKPFAALVFVLAGTCAQAATMNVTIQAQVTENAGGALTGIVNIGDIIAFNIVVESANPDANASPGAYTATNTSNVETLFIVLVDGPANISTTGSTTWTATGLLDLTSTLPATYMPWTATINGTGMTPNQILANFSSISGGSVYLDASAVAGPGMTVQTNVVGISVTTWSDNDGDGIGNAGDNDDDNDNIPDVWETEFGTNPLVDDAAADPDSDSVSNWDEYVNGWDPLSTDLDSDGIADSMDNCVKNGNSLQTDSDSDGSGDACDDDDDGDSMPDSWELANGLNPLVDDANDDADSDSVSNANEYANDSDPQEGDTDSDTVNDGSDNCPDIANTVQTDTDSDGAGNACDDDDDNDGLSDVYELANGLNPLVDDAFADLDSDGIDNTTEKNNGTNPNAADTDSDGDADGVDNCPLAANSTQLDTDSDGAGNACDNDDDNDGMLDFYELQFGLNSLVDDTADDLDGDGYTNLEELQRGTYPNVFNPSLVRNDLNGDGDSDLLARNGSTGAWRLYGIASAALAGSQDININPTAQYITRLDTNGDNDADVLTRNTSDGSWTSWSVSLGLVASASVDITTNLSWQYQGAGDFNDDGIQDVLVRHTSSGLWYVYYLNGDGTTSNAPVGIYSNAQFVIQGVGDLNGDHRDDVLFRSTSTGAWYVYNFATSSVSIVNSMWRSNDWQFQALMDVNKDGRDDIICRVTNPLSANAGVWGAFTFNSSLNIASIYALSKLYINLSVIALADTGDYDANGTGDFLLRNTSTGQHYMFTTNTPSEASPGQQTMRGYPAIAASPWAVLK